MKSASISPHTKSNSGNLKFLDWKNKLGFETETGMQILTFILRHDFINKNVQCDESGYINVKDIFSNYSIPPISDKELELLVETNDKYKWLRSIMSLVSKIYDGTSLFQLRRIV